MKPQKEYDARLIQMKTSTPTLKAAAWFAIGEPLPVSDAAYLTEIWAPRGRDIVRLDAKTLDLLEAERDYVRLHAREQVYLLRATLRALEERLDPTQFVRVHRSAIVRIQQITELHRAPTGGWSVKLLSGRKVRVGRSFRSSIRKITGQPA